MNGAQHRGVFDTIFSQGFRPLFFGAGLGAAIAVAIWLSILRGDATLTTSFAPTRWHAHEMLFGAAAAALGGFVLTAIPNWTGRTPVRGTPLVVLVTAWLVGRIAVATSAIVGNLQAAVLDLSFWAILFALVVREIVAARIWRHAPAIRPALATS